MERQPANLHRLNFGSARCRTASRSVLLKLRAHRRRNVAIIEDLMLCWILANTANANFHTCEIFISTRQWSVDDSCIVPDAVGGRRSSSCGRCDVCGHHAGTRILWPLNYLQKQFWNLQQLASCHGTSAVLLRPSKIRKAVAHAMAKDPSA